MVSFFDSLKTRKNADGFFYDLVFGFRLAGRPFTLRFYLLGEPLHIGLERLRIQMKILQTWLW